MTQKDLDHFADVYSSVTRRLSNLQLDEQAIRTKISGISRLAGQGDVEGYTDEVFGDATVQRALQSIDSGLDRLPENDRRRVASMVQDCLFSACLVPVRETSSRDISTLGTTKVYRRQAIEIMPLSLLRDTLEGIRDSLNRGDNPLDTQGIRPLRYNEVDPLNQRLVSLSLLNLKADSRSALSENKSFQKMLDSGELLTDVLFASSGHDEQQFMATCVVSAASTDVRGRAPTLLGLVEIGRGVARKVQERLDALPEQTRRQKERSSTFGGSRTLEQLVKSRLKEAESEFAAIERGVDSLATRKKESQADYLEGLSARWGRVMQKLAAVSDLTEGVKQVPVLTKKNIKGTWGINSVISAPTLLDRPKRRFGGFNDNYFGAVSDQLNAPAISSESRKKIAEIIDDAASMSGGDRSAGLAAFWQVVLAQSGIDAEVKSKVSEHHYYVKPIRRGGDAVFALSDPKVAGFTYLSLDEFGEWADSTGATASAGLLQPVATLAVKKKAGTQPDLTNFQLAPLQTKQSPGKELQADESWWVSCESWLRDKRLPVYSLDSTGFLEGVSWDVATDRTAVSPGVATQWRFRSKVKTTAGTLPEVGEFTIWWQDKDNAWIYLDEYSFDEAMKKVSTTADTTADGDHDAAAGAAPEKATVVDLFVFLHDGYADAQEQAQWLFYEQGESDCIKGRELRLVLSDEFKNSVGDRIPGKDIAWRISDLRLLDRLTDEEFILDDSKLVVDSRNSPWIEISNADFMKLQ